MSSRAAKKRSRNRRLSRIYTEAGGICFYCNEAILENEATMDHKIPRCRGGSNDDENMVLSCQIDNSMKSFLTAEEYIETLERYPDLIILRGSLKAKRLAKAELKQLVEDECLTE